MFVLRDVVCVGLAKNSGNGVACEGEERSAEPPEANCSLKYSEMADGDKRFETGTGGARCDGLINWEGAAGCWLLRAFLKGELVREAERSV